MLIIARDCSQLFMVASQRKGTDFRFFQMPNRGRLGLL